MTIASDIAALLTGSAVQNIRFTAESVRIDGHVYRQVADAISAGRITISVGGPMPAGADALYDSNTNTLSLLSAVIASVYQKQVVVHEMTHAATDSMGLRRSRGLHRTENEGIAYLAEALYVLNVRGPRAGPTDYRFARVADRIAQRVVAARHHYIVSPAEMRELRNAVGQESGYRSIRGQIKITDGI